MDKQLQQALQALQNRKETLARDLAREISKLMDEFVDDTGVEVVRIGVGIESLQTIGSRPKLMVSSIGVDLNL